MLYSYAETFSAAALQLNQAGSPLFLLRRNMSEMLLKQRKTPNQSINLLTSGYLEGLMKK